MAAGRVVAFLIGRGFAIYKSIWLFRSAPASGLIVELNPIKDQEYTTSYVLRFTFSDNRGRAYTVTSSVQNSRRRTRARSIHQEQPVIRETR
jgi:hypothetical protein